MMSYTVYDDGKIQALIEKDLAAIIKEIRASIPNTVSIVLIGGFGRAEGGVVVRDGAFGPLNDYDTLVVTKGKAKESLIIKAQQHLRQTLTIGLVDICAIDIQALSQSRPSLFNYELYSAHKVIWGDRGIIANTMPKIKSEDISLFDGARLFLNRGGDLVQAARKCFFSNDVSLRDKEFLIFHFFKTIIAVGDVFLIKNRKYHFSYQKRKQLIKEINLADSESWLKEAYPQAIDFKLKADFAPFYAKDLWPFWLKAQTNHMNYFKYFEQERLNSEISDWRLYYPRVYRTPRNVAKNFIRQVKSFGFPCGLKGINYYLLHNFERLYSCLPLILYALDRDAINTDFLNIACRRLNIAMPAEAKAQWLKAAETYLRLWHN